MENLNLVLENIRLSSIEKLLLEATSEDELHRGVQLINESFGLVEEAFRIDTQDKAQKFARRATKALGPDYSINAVPNNQLLGAAASATHPAILPTTSALGGALLGTGVGAIVDGLDSNEEDPITAGTGALAGAGAGALRGLVLNRKFGPGRTQPIIDRLQRDGGQLSQDDLNTLDQASKVAAIIPLQNRFQNRPQ